MQWQVEEKMEKVHGEPKQLMESNKFYKDVNGNYSTGKTNAEINVKKDACYEKYKDAKKSLKTNYCRQKQRSKISDIRRWNT